MPSAAENSVQIALSDYNAKRLENIRSWMSEAEPKITRAEVGRLLMEPMLDRVADRERAIQYLVERARITREQGDQLLANKKRRK